MIQVNSTEFKNHVGKFIKLSQSEDVLIVRNGKVVAKLTSASKSEKEIAYNRLMNMIKQSKPVTDDIDLKEVREERLNRYDNIT